MRTHWKGLVLLTGIILLSGCSSQPRNNWPACAAGGGITWAAGGPWAAVGGAVIGGAACAFSDVAVLDDMQRIHFSFDSDRLDSEAKDRLDNLASYLMHNPDMRVMLSGHADNIGSANYNLHLSKRRAMSAYLYLQEKGVSESQMQTEALGESNPIAENQTDEGRAMNRRTEVVPLTK